MPHGSSPRHARKPRKARAKKPVRAAAPEPAESAPKPTPPASKPVPKAGGAQRLQKLLAAAGFGSRRDVEQFLVEERVTVNGRVAKLGSRADPFVDEIRVDGEKLARERPAYWIVNKPRGVITTVRDDEGRRTVMALLPRSVGRVFPVGRLDLETSGLLLLTNDGDLAHAMLHPSLGNEREYRVNVKGKLDAKAIGRLERGVTLDEGRTSAVKVSDVSYDADSHTSSLSLTLVEGKKRQIRRSLLVLGFPVRRLVRVRMGPLRIGRLAVGEARPLRSEERRALLEHVRRLRAGEPVQAPARTGSHREDLAAAPRQSGARRGRGVPKTRGPKSASASPPRGPRGAKGPPSAPRGAKSPPSAPRGAKSSPNAARGTAAPPRGPRNGPATPARGRSGERPPRGPRTSSGPRGKTAAKRRTSPAGPRKASATRGRSAKKKGARKPSGARGPARKGARKKAETRRPTRPAGRKGGAPKTRGGGRPPRRK